MLRCLVVDDEQPARERIKRLLAKYKDIEIVAEAGDGLSALETIAEFSPDAVFLDIEMPELSGLEVAKTIGARGLQEREEPPPEIVFATAYDEFAVQAFEASATDYLVKPIKEERLERSIERLRQRVNDKRKRIESSSKISPIIFEDSSVKILLEKLLKPRGPRRMAVRVGAKYEVFDPARVSAIIARDHYSTFIINDKEVYSEDSLDLVQSRLDENLFLRVHRSAIINTDFLSELVRQGDRKYIARLSDEKKTELPISRERLSMVKGYLGI